MATRTTCLLRGRLPPALSAGRGNHIPAAGRVVVVASYEGHDSPVTHFSSAGSRPRQPLLFVRMASTSASSTPPAGPGMRTIHSSSSKHSAPDIAAASTTASAAAAALLNTTAAAAADVLSPPPQQPSSETAETIVMPRPLLPRAKKGSGSSSPLSVLPLSVVLRSWATTTISSSPYLLRPSLAVMSALAHTSNPLLNPDRNPLLHFLLKKTFYAQFCAGETPTEVRQTIASLKRIGFTGVILGYAREVVLPEEQTQSLESSCSEGAEAVECIRTEIIPWADGTMETVRLASPGDFVALKFTGAGRQALYHLSARLPPSPALASAIDDICALASSRGVRLLFDAEQQAVQAGIDDWTLAYMRRHNAPGRSGGAVVYGTYQAYLKATPQVLTSHLRAAAEGDFALGVKLVRGAYLGSDPRHLMHDCKQDTDRAYDGIVAALLRREWSAPLEVEGRENGGERVVEFPAVDMVLASHNAESVRKGREIVEGGQARTKEVAFAQLQGMADEVSCELVAAAGAANAKAKTQEEAVAVVGRKDGVMAREVKKKQDALHTMLLSPAIRSYKYLVWGSTGECMKYLLRRAQENRDAVQRTRSGRDAMAAELRRRARAVFGGLGA